MGRPSKTSSQPFSLIDTLQTHPEVSQQIKSSTSSPFTHQTAAQHVQHMKLRSVSRDMWEVWSILHLSHSQPHMPKILAPGQLGMATVCLCPLPIYRLAPPVLWASVWHGTWTAKRTEWLNRFKQTAQLLCSFRSIFSHYCLEWVWWQIFLYCKGWEIVLAWMVFGCVKTVEYLSKSHPSDVGPGLPQVNAYLSAVLHSSSLGTGRVNTRQTIDHQSESTELCFQKQLPAGYFRNIIKMHKWGILYNFLCHSSSAVFKTEINSSNCPLARGYKDCAAHPRSWKNNSTGEYS